MSAATQAQDSCAKSEFFAQTTTATERYCPASEKVLAGHPEQSLRNHYASACDQFNAGVWEGTIGQRKIDTPSTNTAKSSRESR